MARPGLSSSLSILYQLGGCCWGLEAAAESGSSGPGVREEQQHGDGKCLMPSA